MPRKRNDVAPAETAEQEPGEPSAPETSTEKPRGKRKGVYVPLNEAGEIDTARFSAEARKQFELIQGGLGAAPQSPTGFQMDRESIPHLYDAVATGLRMALSAIKWPADLLQFVAYSKEQKDRLTEPTAKVIERFAPAWLLANSDLVMLGVIFAGATKEMLESAKQQYVQLPHVAEAIRRQQEAAQTKAAAA